MIQSHFHSIANEALETPVRPFRSFVGNGGPQLLVPGLLAIIAVRVGSTDIPLTMKEEVLIDVSEASKTEWHEHELIKVVKGPDGTPILLRSIKSNDGNWQAGETVYVSGHWEDEKSAAEADDSQKAAKSVLAAAKAKLKAAKSPDEKSAAEAEVKAAEEAIKALG